MNSYLRDVLSSAGLIETRSSWMTGFFMGAGIGVLAGAVAAALLTPTSGVEMRTQLGSKAKDLADKTQRALSEAGQRTQQALADAGSRLTEQLPDPHHGRNNVLPMS